MTFDARQTRITTMKTISRRIVRVLLTLCVLGLIATGARADDAADWAHQQAQAQKERDDWYAQQAQAQRDREQAERDRQARDDWYKQQEQAQKDRDEWYRQQAQTQRDRDQAERDQKERDEWDKYQWQVHRDYQQSILDGIERVKQQRDEILNKTYDDHPWARAGWTAAAEWTAGGWVLPDSAIPGRVAAESVPPSAPAARSVSAPQARLQATSQQRLAMQNPAAFQQMVLQNQALAPQQIMQTRQQMLPGRQEAAQSQVIDNPFVGSRTMIPGSPQLDHQIIENPFVGRSI